MKLTYTLATLGWVVVLMVAAACSADNREGPDVTCGDLACGRINACQDGIIAQCADGIGLRFRVCTDALVCEREWQISGEYRCTAEDTDCEGCRPDRIEGCGWLDPADQGERGGAGGEAGLGGDAGGGGAGGSVDESAEAS